MAKFTTRLGVTNISSAMMTMLARNANINLFLIEIICSSLLASNSSIFVATK